MRILVNIICAGIFVLVYIYWINQVLQLPPWPATPKDIFKPVVHDKSKVKPLTILIIWPEGLRHWETAKDLENPDNPTTRSRSLDPVSGQTKCVFTTNKSRVGSADAVIHFGAYNKPFNGQKRSKKRWLDIAFESEPPNYPVTPDVLFKSLSFNWTFSYRRDSSVYGPYGSFHLNPRFASSPPSPEEIAQMKNHTLQVPPDKLDFYKKEYLHTKNSGPWAFVTWLVSHCKTNSMRENFVVSLESLLAIDVFGRCAPLRCPDEVAGKPKVPQCYAFLGAKYKFYFALENTFCVDYVTEKFWLALEHKMVPLVYGGAQYKEIAPPGSFINILDYKTAGDLVRYLKYLDQTPTEYLKYFLWREKYELSHGFPWWDICDKMYNVSEIDEEKNERVIRANYTRVIKNPGAWWFMASGKSEILEGNFSGSWNNSRELQDKIEDHRACRQLPEFPWKEVLT